MIEANEYRNGMSLLTAAVNVITTDGTQGKHGFTASAVCSVTDTPPTLLVCVNQTVRSHAQFLDHQVLAVNVLASQHEHISNAFASSKFDSEQRFKLGNWTTLQTGSPVLTDALVTFDCEISEVQQVGTHSVLMCRVVAMKKQNEEQESLVYFNRAYHHIGEVETI